MDLPVLRGLVIRGFPGPAFMEYISKLIIFERAIYDYE